MNTKKISCVLGALLISVTIYAQSSEKISHIISTEKVTSGQIAYLAGTCMGAVSDDDSDNKAFKALADLGYFSSTDNPDGEVSLKQAAFVFMKAAKIKGGLFYSLTGSPRYAFKELKAKGIIPGTADPDMKITGRDALGILNGCLALTFGDK